MRVDRLDEGDWTEVTGAWRGGQILHVSEIRNLATRARVSPGSQSTVLGCSLAA